MARSPPERTMVAATRFGGRTPANKSAHISARRDQMHATGNRASGKAAASVALPATDDGISRAGQRVFVVDDDPLICDTIEMLLETYTVLTYQSAEAFLATAELRSGDCLITDVRMPDMSGISLHHELNKRGVIVPVIMITGYGDVPLAVEAMKAGAYDFIEKPFDAVTLQKTVSRALERAHIERDHTTLRQHARNQIERLTDREREIFRYLTAGHSNKMIAQRLRISPRTVEAHRARIQQKLNVSGLAELLQLAHDAEFHGKKNKLRAAINRHEPD